MSRGVDETTRIIVVVVFVVVIVIIVVVVILINVGEAEPVPEDVAEVEGARRAEERAKDENADRRNAATNLGGQQQIPKGGMEEEEEEKEEEEEGEEEEGEEEEGEEEEGERLGKRMEILTLFLSLSRSLPFSL